MEEIYDGTELLPLDSFFEELKRKRFAVTPLQVIHTHKVIIEYSASVRNEKQLCQYLSPIFAGTEEEQILFKQVFAHHFEKDDLFQPLTQKKSTYQGYAKKHYKGVIALYVFLALVILAVIIQTVRPPRIDRNQITVSLKDKNHSAEKDSSRGILQVNANEKLEIEPVCRYKDRRDPNFDIYINYDWGDGKNDDLSYHIYNTTGTYHLLAHVYVLYKSDTITNGYLKRLVKVCNEGNHLSISVFKLKDPDSDSIKVNDQVTMQAFIAGNQPVADSNITWYVNDHIDGYSNNRWTYLVSPGENRIMCLVIYDSANSNCTLQKDTTITVYSLTNNNVDTTLKLKPVKQTTNTDHPFEVKAPPYLYALYGALAIAFLLLAIFFLFMWSRETGKKANIKRSVQEKLNELTSTSKDKKKINTLSFKNKNSMPVDENEFNVIARQMRTRVNDTVSFLHINKTINKSINACGLFQAVIESRTRQTEYLILIDENKKYIQQVKFFEYLLGILRKQNVLIEKYYYNKEPLLFYNDNDKAGSPLEKLSERYPGHILLIFGDASQFINKSFDTIDKSYRQMLERWQYKAVVTPVPFMDWDVQEKDILLPQIPVFPVDMEGLVLMAELIKDNATENDNDIIARLRQNSGIFYNTKAFNFKNTNELFNYCDRANWSRIFVNGKPVNILFEWIAALAIYPAIHWEMIIAIGKAILDRYNMSEELNFTNLLRIIRIDWIREGYFPPQLRLELLKKLKPENELVARETILELLKEIPKHTIDKAPAAYREQEMQRVINEFSLYANDPVVYSSYVGSKQLFEELWKEDKIDDEATRMYLKNEEQQWGTLINIETNDSTVKNVSVEEYFVSMEKEETLLSRLYLWLGIISIIVFVSSVFAFRILYIWDNVL